MIESLIISMAIMLSVVIYWVTYNLVHNVKWALWLKYEMFNRKPFNCGMCLNFWTNVAVIAVLSPLMMNPYYTLTHIVMTVLFTLSYKLG